MKSECRTMGELIIALAGSLGAAQAQVVDDSAGAIRELSFARNVSDGLWTRQLIEKSVADEFRNKVYEAEGHLFESRWGEALRSIEELDQYALDKFVPGLIKCECGEE